MRNRAASMSGPATQGDLYMASWAQLHSIRGMVGPCTAAGAPSVDGTTKHKHNKAGRASAVDLLRHSCTPVGAQRCGCLAPAVIGVSVTRWQRGGGGGRTSEKTGFGKTGCFPSRLFCRGAARGGGGQGKGVGWPYSFQFIHSATSLHAPPTDSDTTSPSGHCLSLHSRSPPLAPSRACTSSIPCTFTPPAACNVASPAPDAAMRASSAEPEGNHSRWCGSIETRAADNIPSGATKAPLQKRTS